MYMYVYLYRNMCICVQVPMKDRKRESDLLELELQAIVSHLKWALGLLEEQHMLLTTEPRRQTPRIE